MKLLYMVSFEAGGNDDRCSSGFCFQAIRWGQKTTRAREWEGPWRLLSFYNSQSALRAVKRHREIIQAAVSDTWSLALEAAIS